MKTEYAPRRPSADRLMVCALRPVVRRTGSPIGFPPPSSITRKTSRPPRRPDTNSRLRPPGSQAGLVLSDASSVTLTACPPRDGTSQIELGATLPRLVGLPQGWAPKVKAAFPDTNAIHSPSGDHASPWGALIVASRVAEPPSIGRTNTTEFSTYAIRFPSGDQAGCATQLDGADGRTSGRGVPPRAETR